MIKKIGNGLFYKTLAEQQIAKIAERNKTSFDVSKIILKNNQRLCDEINLYNKTNNPLDIFVYCLDSTGKIIKKVKHESGVLASKVSDNDLIRLIEKIRTVK